MLTVNGIKNFCFDSIGIFLRSKDDIKVEKRNSYYIISLNNKYKAFRADIQNKKIVMDIPEGLED